jgi:hypothetical protein
MWWLAVSFLLPFSVYVYTLCPTVSVYADAGEAPTFAVISGFIHPPGYPLFVLLTKLFLLLPFGNPAWKANLTAAFFAAATITLFYLLLKQLFKASFPALTAVLILAFSRIFWFNALISEVFSLLMFFISLSLLLYLLWLKTGQKKFLFAFIMAAGFGFFHHQTIVFVLFPLFLYFLFAKQWRGLNLKDYFISLLCFFSGFLPYLYILLYAAPRQPPMNWNNPVTIARLFQLIRRASYGTFSLTVGDQTIDFLKQTLGQLKLLFQSFSWLGAALFLIGCVYSLRKHLKILLGCLFVIVVVFVFCIFSGMPIEQLVQIQYLERFHLISSLFIALIIGFGLVYLYQLIGLLKVKPLRYALLFLLLLSPFLLLKLNYQAVNQRDNYFADQLVEDIFKSIPQNSVFIVDGDGLINSLFYHRYVIKQRPDISYIVGGMFQAKPAWYLEEIQHHYPDLILPDPSLNRSTYLTAFMQLNSTQKNVLFSIPALEVELNLNLPKIGQGLVWQYVDLYRQEPPSVSAIEEQLLQFLDQSTYLNRPTRFRPDSAEYALTSLYTVPYIYLAEINHQELAKSEKYYSEALKIQPDNFVPYLELGDDYAMHGQFQAAVEMWQESLKYIWDKNLQLTIQEKINEAGR